MVSMKSKYHQENSLVECYKSGVGLCAFMTYMIFLYLFASTKYDNHVFCQVSMSYNWKCIAEINVNLDVYEDPTLCVCTRAFLGSVNQIT